MENFSIAKTYVKHKDKWFFISTIERDCSAVGAENIRYNETMVWKLKGEPGSERENKILGQGEDVKGSIKEHNRIARIIYDSGENVGDKI